MIKPEASDFFGDELDKAKLEIASYWKDKYEKTQKALEIAVDVLKEIDETRSYSKEPLQAINNRILNAGVCFCWTLPDNIHRALWKINNIDKGE